MTTSVTSSSTIILHNNCSGDLMIEQLREALEERSQVAIRLNQMKSSKIPISQISRELIEYCFSHDEPLSTDVPNNPWKKSLIIPPSGTGTTATTNSRVTVLKKDSDVEIVALGVDSGKVEQVLMNMKSDIPVSDAERIYYLDFVTDMAISVLRILVTHVINTTQSLEVRSNSINNSQRLLKPKDETYLKRPLPANLHTELKHFWNEPTVQHAYKNERSQILPKHLLYAIDKFNICERIFGDVPMSLTDAEVLHLTSKAPINQGIVEYIYPKFKVYDVSSLKMEYMENWLPTFYDCKTFVWICSLNCFDQVILDNKKVKFTIIQPKPKLNGKNVKNSTSPPNSPGPVGHLNISSNSSITSSSNNSVLNNSNSSALNNSTGFTNPISTITNESNVMVENSSFPLPPNALQRSVELFRIFSKNIKRPPIVFLTDKEQFAEKVNRTNFSTYFPSYTGAPKKPKDILEFIKNLFNPNNDVTVHFTRFDAKEDEKVIAATLYAIAAEESIDILI